MPIIRLLLRTRTAIGLFTSDNKKEFPEGQFTDFQKSYNCSLGDVPPDLQLVRKTLNDNLGMTHNQTGQVALVGESLVSCG